MSDTSKSENTSSLSLRKLTRRMIQELPISATPPSYFKVPDAAPPSKKRRTSARESGSKTPMSVTFDDLTPKNLLRLVLREKKTRRSSLPAYIPSRISESGGRSNRRSLKRLSKSLGESSTSLGSDLVGSSFGSENNATRAQPVRHRGLRGEKITLKNFDSELQKVENSILPTTERLMGRRRKRKVGRPRITVDGFATALDKKQDEINLETDTTLRSPRGKNRKWRKGVGRQMTLDDFVNGLDLQMSGNEEGKVDDEMEVQPSVVPGKQKDNVRTDKVVVLPEVVPSDSLVTKDQDVETVSLMMSPSANISKRRQSRNFPEDKIASLGIAIMTSTQEENTEQIRVTLQSPGQSTHTSPGNTFIRTRQFSNYQNVVIDMLASPGIAMNQSEKKPTERTFPHIHSSRSSPGSPVNVSFNRRQSRSIVEDVVVSPNTRMQSLPRKLTERSPVNKPTRTPRGSMSHSPVSVSSRQPTEPTSVNSQSTSMPVSPVTVSVNRKQSSKLNINEASPVDTSMRSSLRNLSELTPRSPASVSPVNVSFNGRQFSIVEANEIGASPFNSRMQSVQKKVTEQLPINTSSPRVQAGSPLNVSASKRRSSHIKEDEIWASLVSRPTNFAKEAIDRSTVHLPINEKQSSNIEEDAIAATPVNSRMQSIQEKHSEKIPVIIHTPNRSVPVSSVNASLNRSWFSSVGEEEILTSPGNTRMRSVQKKLTPTLIVNAPNKSARLRNSTALPMPAFVPNDYLTNLPSTSGYKPGQKNPQISEDWQRSAPPLSPVISTSEEEVALDVSKAGKATVPPSKRAVKKPRKIDVGLGNQTRALFQHFSRMPVENDAFPLVEEITEMFFENTVVDLEAYARHARRKTIQPSDVVLLMKRQKFITKNHSLQFLAAKYLPMKYREEIIPCIAANGKIFP